MYNFSTISYLGKNTTKEIRGLQETLSQLTGSTGALQDWEPHITVGSGITVSENELSSLYEQIKEVLKDIPPITLTAKGFSFMDNWTGAELGFSPYVVYIELSESEVLKAIALFFEEEIKPHYPVWYNQPWPFNPHITLAYKDLTKEGYEQAKEYLADREFKKSVVIDNVCLAVEEDGPWKEFKRFTLG